MIISTQEQRDTLIEAGRRLGVIMDKLAEAVAPGVAVGELDALAERLIREGGDVPSLLGYQPEGATRPYPATLCVSVNDEVVHGIPTESTRVLKEGDIVGLDLVLTHNGVFVDSAMTVSAGKTDKGAYALMDATAAALEAGIDVAKAGGYVGDISHAIESAFIGTRFSVVKLLCGHGVGGAVHEEPTVPNTGRAGAGEELVPGMVLALEPIANEGKGSVTLTSDGYTYRTRDGMRSAHFEHTILIEEEGAPLVVTRRPSER